LGVPRRTIRISLEAYEALRRLKRAGESFSDVILRLARGRPDLSELAGAWGDVPEEGAEKVLRSVRGAWASSRVQR
jgi:predicted CopG family antitoxin